MHCEESPQVWFTDVVRVPIRGHASVQAIDERFLEVCEPQSIIASSYVADLPVSCGVRVEDGHVLVRVAESEFGFPEEVVVTVRGIRKDFAGVRFPPKTRSDFDRNEAFLAMGR